MFQHLEGHAALHELCADRDGGDGLLPGEVSFVWQDSSWQEKGQTTRSVQEVGWQKIIYKETHQIYCNDGYGSWH